MALALGHLALDFDQGALVILVPALHEALGTSVGRAGSLVAAWTFASAILQPMFGHLGDRHDILWTTPAGLCLATGGLVGTALAPAYVLALAGAALGGAGTAMFHPEAARRVARLAGRWRATGMSYLWVGGNVGYALGVLVAAPIVVSAGPSGIALLSLPGLAYAALLAGVLRRPGPTRSAVTPRVVRIPGRLTAAVCLLVMVVAIRSTVSVGIAALGPLYLHVDRGLPLTVDASITAAFLLAGAAGTTVGGNLADRFGRRGQMLASFAAMVPLGLLFLLLPDWAGYVALILMGGATLSSVAVTVVLAQELMPARTGIASGLVLGLGFAVGGLAVGALGALADRVGLVPTMWVLCLVPLLAVALTLGIPETAASRRSTNAGRGGDDHGGDRLG